MSWKRNPGQTLEYRKIVWVCKRVGHGGKTFRQKFPKVSEIGRS